MYFMLFLIDYDRAQGTIVTLRTFLNNESRAAQSALLDIELDHHRSGIKREVVLLDAESEGALRRTHGRYFMNALELVKSFDSLFRERSRALVRMKTELLRYSSGSRVSNHKVLKGGRCTEAERSSDSD
jgi:hypothetical protein